MYMCIDGRDDHSSRIVSMSPEKCAVQSDSKIEWLALPPAGSSGTEKIACRLEAPKCQHVPAF